MPIARDRVFRRQVPGLLGFRLYAVDVDILFRYLVSRRGSSL